MIYLLLNRYTNEFGRAELLLSIGKGFFVALISELLNIKIYI